MKTAFVCAVTAIAAMTFVGCASKHESGVTSNYRSQWTDVAADATVTTDAAKAVLEDEGLKNVMGSSTNVDGKATGKKADGTVVNVMVKKDPKATMSQVSVTVGMMGDPALGADMAKKIKMKAEGMAPMAPMAPKM